jgi:transposase
MPHHQIHLSCEEDAQLLSLSQDGTLPARVRLRAEALRLSSRGWTAPQIAKFFDCHPKTIRETFQRWWNGGLQGLHDAPRQGIKPRWTAEDIAYLEKRILEDEQTYTAEQLSDILYQERGVRLSAIPLRRVLKKTALSGNAHARVLLEQIQRYSRRNKNSLTS